MAKTEKGYGNGIIMALFDARGSAL